MTNFLLYVLRISKHILKSEWKSLTSPERIQQLAKHHLINMQQMEASQLCEFEPQLFHSEQNKYKRTKRLSKLVDEVLSEQHLQNGNEEN